MYAKWEHLHSWAYFSNSKNGWLCKICEEYSDTGDDYWKNKVRAHDEHPNKMFQLHLNGEKHKKAINKKHALHSMLRKGNIVSQITTGIENSQIEKVQRNRRVISKLIKTVYFMSKKQWPVKNNFYDLIEHIKNLGDVDLIKHFQTMDKNATYVSKFTVDEFVKICSDFIEEKFLTDILTAGEFAILTDESTDEAGRAQLSIFIRYVDAVAHEPKEEFVCIRKLSTSKTSEAIMNELESMFVEKKIDKTKIRFSGLDGTNAMSGERKGLQRRIRHVSPFAVYMNCRNHRLALCLVHLLKSYSELESLDKLLLSLWKLFEYSSVKQAVFENAQKVDDLKPLKILKACTTRWLTHGETSARVISRFKQVIAALDALTNEKRDEDAKGIRDQLLSPTSILMLLLLAEVLVPINNFCRFLQTRNLNYSLIMSKFQRVVTKLEKIKTNL